MLKRLTLVLLALLLLNGCAEVIGLLGGVEVVGEISLNNRNIQVSDVNETGFTLYWDEASYSDGTYGSFYYELYVVEGNQLNVNNLNYGSKVTSGRNINHYTVTGLDPNMNYSFVVAVSEDEFGSQLYYNIGSATTLPSSTGNTDGYSPANRNINLYDVTTNGFTLTWESTTNNDGSYGSFYYEVYIIEGTLTNINYLSNTDMYASGWDFNSYTVEYLNPNTTYSFVIGVSDDGTEAGEYYNIGTVTTQSHINNNVGYSPNNYNINIYDTTTDGFSLTWESTTNNNGTYGSFYYEVYIVEGTLYNTDYLSYTDMYASGWDFNSYAVEYLNPDTTYSFVVGVSDDGAEAEVYYNIGTVTTQSYINIDSYSPSNTYIDVYDIGTNNFTLYWSPTNYDNGSYGSFYYKLYVVEGYEYNENNFTYYDIVTEGWDLTSYMVSALNPDTAYSYVVGVSDDGYESQVYYSIGHASTQPEYTPSTDFMGSWEFTDGSLILLYNFYSDSFTIDMYDEYANFMMTYSGSLSVLSDTSFILYYETITDEYGNVSPDSGSNTISWSMNGDNLTINGDTLTPYDGIIDPIVDPDTIYLYPSYSWVDGYINPNEEIIYNFYVNPGADYTIAWDDSYVGSGLYDLDVKVSAWDENGNTYFTELDSGYDYPQIISIPYGVYNLSVKVQAWSTGSYGSYAIKVTEFN